VQIFASVSTPLSPAKFIIFAWLLLVTNICAKYGALAAARIIAHIPKYAPVSAYMRDVFN